jgi:hypothetical protein
MESNYMPDRLVKICRIGLPVLLGFGLLIILALLLGYESPARAEVNDYFVSFAGSLEFSQSEAECGLDFPMLFPVTILGAGDPDPFPDVPVAYEVVAGGQPAGTPDVDYISASGTITFTTPSQVINIPVTLVCDNSDEPNEQFKVELHDPLIEHIIINPNNKATGIIEDDDIPIASINSVTVTEGDQGDQTPANLLVTLSIPPYQPVSLQYDTVPDTASSLDNDYLQVSGGNLNIPAGATEVPLSVTVLGDVIDEGVTPEHFTVQLASNLTQTVDVAENSNIADIYIQDDDTAGFTVQPTRLMTMEDGSISGTFWVSLVTEPVDPVTITLTSENTQEIVLDKDSLTFTGGNWNTPVSVTVSGVMDGIRDGNPLIPVDIEPTGDSDAMYKNLPAKQVAVKNWDVDGSSIYFGSTLKEYRHIFDFFDQFETQYSLTNWDPILASGATQSIINGEYVLEQSTATYNVRSSAKIENIRTDYAVETEVRVPANSDPYTRVGLLFDWLDSQRFYRFIIEPATGLYFVQKFQGGWQDLANGSGYSPYINTGSGVNILKIERRGNEIRIFINGQPASGIVTSDGTYQHGVVGAIIVAPPVLSGGKNAIGIFDNFHAYELND